MEANLIKLEEKFGKYEDWTNQTVVEIVSDEEYLELFSPEMIYQLLSDRKNEELEVVLLPVKCGFLLKKTEHDLEVLLEALDQGKIDQEQFEKDILELKEAAESPLELLPIFLVITSLFTEYDVKAEELTLLSLISQAEDILESVDLEAGFQFIIEFLDVVAPFRELYFQKYEVDLFEGDERIIKLQEKLNKVAEEMIKTLGLDQMVDPEAPDPMPTIGPTNIID